MEPGEVYDADRVWALLRAWADLRSRIETTGSVEAEEWCEVLDIERALRRLAAGAPRDDPRRYSRDRDEKRELKQYEQDCARAAGLIAAQMLLGFRTDHDLRFAFGGTDERNARLLERARAWLATYLGGGSFEEAEQAFRAVA